MNEGLSQEGLQWGDGLNLLNKAKQEYPILGGLNLQYKYNPTGGRGMLEFWPQDEPGTQKFPRPQEFPLDSLGVEVYDPRTRPIDILGDVVSHHLTETDPTIKQFYEIFKTSLTNTQKATLKSQYKWAKQNENETRPYSVWEKQTGLPGYFRGYPFQQWEEAAAMYTPDQLDNLDAMMAYLKGRR